MIFRKVLTGIFFLPALAFFAQAQTTDSTIHLGYMDQNKELTTGATNELDGNELSEILVSDLLENLQGLVPGADVLRTTGFPGASATIKLRGTQTSYLSNTPLIILNGVEYNHQVSLNPADIATITVLKSPSETALYGARGANGVILIETKKGADEKLSVNYNSFLGITKKSHDQSTPWPSYYSQDVSTGNRQNHYLSLSGSTQAVRYHFSHSLLDENGLMGENFTRNTSLAQLEGKLGSHVNLGANMLWFQSDSDYEQTGPGGSITTDYKESSFRPSLYSQVNLLNEKVQWTSRLTSDLAHSAANEHTSRPREESQSEVKQKNRKFIFQNMISTTHQFGKHQISGMVGFEHSEGRNTDDQLAYNVLYGGMTSYYASWRKREDKLISAFTQANYSFKNRYNLNLVLRRDSFEQEIIQGKKQKDLYYAVGTSWVLTRENWMSNVNDNLFLKLRLSHGLTGFSLYPYQTEPSNLPSITGYSAYSIVKQNPAKTSIAGLDFGLMKSRLVGSMDFYKTKSKHNGGRYNNSITTTNKGFELNLNSTLIQQDHAQWKLGINYSLNKDNQKIHYVPITRRITNDSVSNQSYAVQGRWRIEGDDTGIPQILSRDSLFTSIGKQIPNKPVQILGIHSHLNIFNFDIGVVAFGQWGKYLTPGSTTWDTEARPEKASFFKIRTASVGYTHHPKSQYLDHIRIYFAVQNAMTFGPMYDSGNGYDPELSGVSGYMPRMYAIGWNLSF